MKSGLIRTMVTPDSPEYAEIVVFRGGVSSKPDKSRLNLVCKSLNCMFPKFVVALVYNNGIKK